MMSVDGNTDSEKNDTIKLTKDHVDKYIIGKTFDVPPDTQNAYINAMSYSSCGTRLVCAWTNEESTLVTYDAIEGKELNSFNKQLSGVERLTFLNNHDVIAIASKTTYQEKKLVALYNIKTKKDIRSYKIHSDTITALKVHPNKDYLMTASKDKEICLWDVNQSSNSAVARLNLEEATHPSIAFDPKGVCFAVGATVRDKTFIQLFDMRKIGDGCFDKFEIDSNGNLKGWHNIQFSPNGKQMLLTPHRTVKKSVKKLDINVPHYLIDSFTGKLYVSLSEHCVQDTQIKNTLKGYEGPMYASFSPDSNFIISGDRDSNLRVWSTKESDDYELINRWTSGVNWHKKAPIGPVLWNPYYDSVACASLKLSLWQKYSI